MKEVDTVLAQPHNCIKHILVHSPSKTFKCQKACTIECRGHTCHSPPASDYDTVFTSMITFQDVLKQKGIE